MKVDSQLFIRFFAKLFFYFFYTWSAWPLSNVSEPRFSSPSHAFEECTTVNMTQTTFLGLQAFGIMRAFLRPLS